MNINLGEYNEKYKQDIGLGIGELFYEKVTDKGLDIGEKAVFDVTSQNYHLYPKMRDEKLESEIKDNRDGIIKLLEEPSEHLQSLLDSKGINVIIARSAKEMNDLPKDKKTIQVYGKK